MSWGGSTGSLPAACKRVMHLCVLPPVPPPIPGESPQASGSHALNCPAIDCYIFSLTNLLSCSPSLTNIFPGSSYCHFIHPHSQASSESCLHSRHLLQLTITPQLNKPAPVPLNESWLCHITMTLLSPTDTCPSLSDLDMLTSDLSRCFPGPTMTQPWVPSCLPGHSSSISFSTGSPFTILLGGLTHS